ncbi:hypothetical protein COO60DRAFT_745157 [Scenedesmus sp. NREL 46B-D3]|nr:hypothetical protein COO60DRAFT_745157 [Scenedesmus sp. NREL 46B-D3]
MDTSSGLMGGKAEQHGNTLTCDTSTAAAGDTATGVAAGNMVPQQVHQLLGQAQQQEWRWQQQQQQHLQQATPPGRPGGCGSVDELLSALRRVTANGRRSTSEAITSPIPAVTAAAAATTNLGLHGPLQQQQQQQQQQQWQTPAPRGVAAAAFAGVPSTGSMQFMNSTADELIGALQRGTDTSRRSTAEAPQQAAAAGMHMPDEQQQQQQQQPVNGSLFGGLSSVDDLIVALRRVTSDHARTAGTPEASQHPVTPLTQQQQQRRPWEQAAATPQQQQQQRRPWEQAAAAPQQQQQQQQAVHPGSAGAADCPVPATPSNVDELIIALRRATGDSRRSTAEAAPSPPGGQGWQPQQPWMGPQGSCQPGGPHICSVHGSLGSVDGLLGALRRATSDSRCGTAESAPDAPAGTADTAAAVAAAATRCVAAEQKDGSAHDPGASAAAAAAAAAAGDPAGLFGGLRSVDDLLGALRATGDSRRATAESAPDAPADTADTPSAAAAAGMGAGTKHRNGVEQGLGGTAGDAAVAARHGGSVGSLSSVDALIQALRNATGGSARVTAEAVADVDEPAKEVTQQQQHQQQHEVGDEQLQRSLAAPDSECRRHLGNCSSFQDVSGALLQAAAGSRHASAESVAEAAAVPLEPQPWEQQQQQWQHSQWQPQSTSGSEQPGSAGCSALHMRAAASTGLSGH